MDNPVLWVLQAPSRSVGFPTENLMPWPGQVSDKSVSDAFSDFSSDVCDYNSIMANPSMYRPGPCLSSLLYSERSLDQDLLDNAGTNCMNGTAQLAGLGLTLPNRVHFTCFKSNQITLCIYMPSIYSEKEEVYDFTYKIHQRCY